MAKIQKRVGYDSMWIKVTVTSGAWIKLKVNRGGETLEGALSNDSATAKEQFRKILEWLKFRGEETNQQRFERLEKLANASNNSTELIANLEKF